MIAAPARLLRGAALQVKDAAWWRSFWPRHRVRRPVDVARLVLAAGALAALVFLAVLDLLPSIPVPTVSRGLARGVLSVGNVAASIAVLAVLLAIAVRALRTQPFRLIAALLAWALGPAIELAVASLTGLAQGAATSVLLGPPHQRAGLPVAAALAFVVGSDLHRSRLIRLAWLAITAAVACPLLLGSLALPVAVYALLVGAATGQAVRVALGVVPARPPDDVVRAVLARAGVLLESLRVHDEAAGLLRYTGTDAHGGEVRITVLDPDRRGVPLAQRGWRLVRFNAAAGGRPALSLRGQLERRALTSALAGSAGVAVPSVAAFVAAGPALVFAERPVAGTPLSAAERPDVAGAWRALHRVHDAGLAHGSLSADAVVLLPDGDAGFSHMATAQPAATDLQRELDVVALLVATATTVGAAEAVRAMCTAYDPSPGTQARVAALLLPLALPRPLRRAVKGTPLLGELRAALAGSGPSLAPPRLERLRPRTVLTLAAGVLAAHLLATQLSQVHLASALRSAHPGWASVALLGSAATYLGAALTLKAFVVAKLRLGRTTLVQLAASFVTLVTPPTVGQVGLNIRYLQREGVPTEVATASVAVKETATVLGTIPVLLICGWLSGVSASRLTLLPSGSVLVVLVAAAALLVLAALLPPTRRLMRRRIEPLVRRTLPALLATLGDPRRLATALTGVLVLNAGYVLALGASLGAFSTSLPLPALVVVYLAASAIGSAAPTPGGLGAVEAALVAGLTASGVPVAAAIPAVLLFRVATFWLPAPLGWVTFAGLQRRGRI